MKLTVIFHLCAAFGIFLTAHIRAAEPIVIPLWPGLVPGATNVASVEHDTSKPGEHQVAGKPVIRLGNVSKPMITIYRPPASHSTGAAIMVCPGGGYSILAYDLEGTEVCEWLNSLGITAALLKYRVPSKDHPPLEDAQRALGLLRSRAAEFGVDPKRIGILGFSAGGNLTTRLSANCSQRAYAAVDAADQTSCRPDFQLLIYPAYMTPTNALDKLIPEIAVTTNTPPTFMVMAMDDPIHVEDVLDYTIALKLVHVPAELHVYPTGGHGYGMRRTKEPVTAWPELAEKWLENRGLLKRE